MVGLFVLVAHAQWTAAQTPVGLSGSDRSSSDGSLVREGLFAGFSFGRGSIEVQCDECGNGSETLTEAFSLQGHLGHMITPQLAVVGEHWTVRYNARGGALFDDNAKHLVAQHVSSLGAQLFLGGSFWVRTGFGVGWHITDGDYAREPVSMDTRPSGASAIQPRPAPVRTAPVSGGGGAYFAAIGWELAASRSFVAEVQLRAATTVRADDQYRVRNIGLNVGASWY